MPPLRHGAAPVSAVSTILAAAIISSSLALVGPWLVGDAVASPEYLLDMVSGEAMIDTVADLQGFVSRAFYTQGYNDSAAYVHERFSELGLSVEYQYFDVGIYQCCNVIATLPGESPDAPMYLFGAHLDSFNKEADSFEEGMALPAPGADDDASGVAAVIEIARILSETDLEPTVKFVAFGAEEYAYESNLGPAGSAAFVAADVGHGNQYAGAIVFDMIGWRSGTANIANAIVNLDSSSLSAGATSAVATWGIDLDLGVIISSSIRFSDHYSFWSAGYPCMLMIEELEESTLYPVNPDYHTPEDTVDKLSADMLTAVTATALGTLFEFEEPIEEHGTDWAVVSALLGLSVVALVSAMVLLRSHSRKGRLK